MLQLNIKIRCTLVNERDSLSQGNGQTKPWDSSSMSISTSTKMFLWLCVVSRKQDSLDARQEQIILTCMICTKLLSFPHSRVWQQENNGEFPWTKVSYVSPQCDTNSSLVNSACVCWSNSLGLNGCYKIWLYSIYN